MRIAQVSDLHVGQFMQQRMLQKVVEATNQLRADLVLLTGDLIDYAVADLSVALDAVKKLDPRSGLAMCVGNHDMMDNGRKFVASVKAAGVPLLNGEDMRVRVRNEDVQLLGLPWVSGDTMIHGYMFNLLKKWKHDAFPILMAHHPHAFDPAANAGLPLTLAGHTHGGQLMLSDRIGCGPLFFRYWSGVYRRERSTLVVSNGVGNWFPLRVRAPAEIVAITLVRGENDKVTR
jgi:predicted MPP superfamily phosphohydrolase